jgi:hypothetical protein
VVVLVIAANMGGQQPHHIGAQVGIPARPHGQVEMVRHQAVSEEAHVRPLAGLGQELDKRCEVAFLVKDGASRVTAIEDVVAVSGSCSSCGAWHGCIVSILTTQGK